MLSGEVRIGQCKNEKFCYEVTFITDCQRMEPLLNLIEKTSDGILYGFENYRVTKTPRIPDAYDDELQFNLLLVLLDNMQLLNSLLTFQWKSMKKMTRVICLSSAANAFVLIILAIFRVLKN